MRKPWLIAAAAVAVLAVPGTASAHVGKTLPVATDFHARVTRPIPGVETRVVDGDQSLWLDAGTHRVLVPGIESEPFLRFDERGVWLNVRSLTAEADKVDRFDLRPSANPHAAPLWHHLTGAHAYLWHDHRLHILEPLAKGLDRAAGVGSWSIPVIVDGRRTALAGVLDYQPPPSSVSWFAAVALLAIGGMLAAWRSRRTTVAIALVTVLPVWALRIGRELYGRPNVPVAGWIEIALTSLVGLALVYGLVRPDAGVRVFVAFLAAFGALYEGATMVTVLTRAVALSALPTVAARVGVVAALAGGAAALAGGWHALGAERRSEAASERAAARAGDARTHAAT